MRGITKGFFFSKCADTRTLATHSLEAADIDPEFAEAWYNKGIALMTLGKYLEAIRTFDKAIAINPNDREAREQRDRALKEDHGVVHIHCAFLKEPDDIDQVIAQSLQEFEQGIQGARSRSRSRGEHANGVRRGGSKKKSVWILKHGSAGMFAFPAYTFSRTEK